MMTAERASEGHAEQHLTSKEIRSHTAEDAGRSAADIGCKSR